MNICQSHCNSVLGQCNKWPQPRRLKTTEIYCLTTLEAKSPKSRCLQVCSLQIFQGRNLPCLFQLLVALNPKVVNPWLMVANSNLCLCLHVTIFSWYLCVYVSSHVFLSSSYKAVFPLCLLPVCLSSYEDTSHIGLTHIKLTNYILS